MGEGSKIQWTHHTFNPWIGCQKVSPGCTNCYAEDWDKRFAAKGSGATRWGPTAPRTRTKSWGDPAKWNRAAALAGVRARVFCASLADVFEDRPELAPWRRDLWQLVQKTPSLDWLLLTKRPQHANRLWTAAQVDGYGFDGKPIGPTWGPNVWLGTTVEDQQRANERIPELVATDAALKFLSVEPQIEAVDLDMGRCDDHGREYIGTLTCGDDGSKEEGCTECAADGWSGELSFGHWLDPLNGGVGWVIQGGESGPRARPFDVQWMRTTAAQCAAAGVAYFAKQLGARPVDGGRDLVLGDSHGGEMSEWPADLQQLGRAFPVVKP